MGVSINDSHEEQWLKSTELRSMIKFIKNRDKKKLNKKLNKKRIVKRKLRLFACACCRNIWHLLTDARSRNAVETMEQYLDGQVSTKDVGLNGAWDVYRDVYNGDYSYATCYAAAAAASAASYDVTGPAAVYTTAEAASSATGYSASSAKASATFDAATFETAYAATKAEQAKLLRIIVGNPFRKIRYDPHWNLANNKAVLNIAQSVCDEKSSSKMPILADALEDAGCTDPTILDHCRNVHVFVRGDWLLELILEQGDSPMKR